MNCRECNRNETIETEMKLNRIFQGKRDVRVSNIPIRTHATENS